MVSCTSCTGYAIQPGKKLIITTHEHSYSTDLGCSKVIISTYMYLHFIPCSCFTWSLKRSQCTVKVGHTVSSCKTAEDTGVIGVGTLTIWKFIFSFVTTKLHPHFSLGYDAVMPGKPSNTMSMCTLTDQYSLPVIIVQHLHNLLLEIWHENKWCSS